MSFLRNTLRQDAYWILNKTFVDVLGLEAAVILTVLIDRYFYYQDNGQLVLNKNEYWFFYTSDRIEADFKIGYKAQKRIFGELKNTGLIKLKSFGVPCKIHFSIDEVKICLLLNSSIAERAELDLTKSENWNLLFSNTLNNNIVNNNIFTNFSFPPNGEKGPSAVKGKKSKGKAPQVAPSPPAQDGSYFEQKPGQGEENNQSGNNGQPGGDNAAEGFKKPQSLYQCIIDKYDIWFKGENDNVPPKFDGQQGKAAKAIITHLKKVVKAKMSPGDEQQLEEYVKSSWALVLDNWKLLEPFYQKRTKLSDINSDLQNILKQLKDGRIKKAGNGNNAATAKGVDDAINERIKAAGGS